MDGKPHQVLQLDPPTELKFKGPFTEVVPSILTIKNPINKRVGFKVKTTAPKKYCVRPNSGIIDAHKHVEINVMLQPFESDMPGNHKHKFMVQSVIAVDDSENLTVESLFQNASSEDLMDSKLKCVFEMPAQPEKVAALETAGEEAPAHLDAREGKGNTEEVSKLTNRNYELKKQFDELQVIHSTICKENIQLKEKMITLEKSRSTATPKILNKDFEKMAMGNKDDNMLYKQLVAAVILVLLGMYLGSAW